MSALAEQLAEARKLIQRGWMQGACATDGDLRRCPESDPGAAYFDAMGAMSRVSHGDLQQYALMCEVYQRAANARYDIATWNDAPERTKAEVLAAFDKAIELTRGDQ